jgi:hypothetical protein
MLYHTQGKHWFDPTVDWTHDLPHSRQALVWPYSGLNPCSTTLKASTGLTLQWIEPMIYHTQGKHTNYYTTELVSMLLQQQIFCTALLVIKIRQKFFTSYVRLWTGHVYRYSVNCKLRPSKHETCTCSVGIIMACNKYNVNRNIVITIN